MKQRKAILTYARFSSPELNRLKQGLDELAIDVKWIAAHNKEEEVSKNVFPDAQNVRWASYRYNIEWTEKFDKKLYDQLLGNKKDTALPIVERYGPFEGGSMEAEMRLAHDFSIAHHMIKNSNPDLIIFAKTPESGLQYCLYLIAKHFKIQTVQTRMGGFPHARVVCTDMDAPILDSNWQPHISVIPVCNLPKKKPALSRLTLEKVKAIRKKKIDIPNYMKVIGVSSNIDDEKFIQFDTELTEEKINNDNNKKDHGVFFIKTMHDYYESIITPLKNIDWNKNIYFFPLHYQPEVTTMPVGNEYVNQLKIIKLLSDQLGKYDLLIVKEHPGTFMAKGKSNINFRNKSFYNWISKLKNVILVSAYINSGYLTNKSSTVIAITGTTGMEAMIKQKKVLAFGNAAYINGPNVFRIDSNTDFEALVKCSLNRTRFSKIKKFLAALDSCSYHEDLQYHDMDELIEKRHHMYISCLLRGLAKI